jgi:hypothetical protein
MRKHARPDIDGPIASGGAKLQLNEFSSPRVLSVKKRLDRNEMGAIIYGAVLRLSLDDRTLAHAQIVIGEKLRRRESFFLSWMDSKVGSGRHSVWISCAVPLHFEYSTTTICTINDSWVALLARSADSRNGLWLVKEPAGITAVEEIISQSACY